jgi:hypothetical protein
MVPGPCKIDHGSVQPDGLLASQGGDAHVALFAFPDEGCGFDVASREDKQTARQRIQNLGAQAAHLLGDQLGRICSG